MSRRAPFGALMAVLAPLALSFAAALPAHAQVVVADLSSRKIAITTGFTGAELLLFGTTDGYGDVVATVRGPVRSEVVRRKQRVAGIWVNGASVTFDGTPAYYRVAASRKLDEIASPELLREFRIGTETLDITTSSARKPGEIAEFRSALFRNKRKLGLYGEAVSDIEIKGGRLFRTTIPFPTNVPTGGYVATIFLFHEGRMIRREEASFTVSKVGIEAELFSFAHEQAALYGIAAIIIALVAGWAAGVAFRRS